MHDVDLVIEAVFELIEIKHKVFESLVKHTKPDCILASNTSALDIDKIAEACPSERREYIVGMHFFSPADIMMLLENVKTK